MSEFFSMGGYAQFVWPSYVLTFLAIGVNIWFARRVFRQAREDARRRIAVGDVAQDAVVGRPGTGEQA